MLYKCVHGVEHSREDFLAAAAWGQRTYGDATLEDLGLRCWIEAWRAANLLALKKETKQ